MVQSSGNVVVTSTPGHRRRVEPAQATGGKFELMQYKDTITIVFDPGCRAI